MKENNIDKVRNLFTLFQAGQIPTLPQHEVHPDVPLDSRENYLYFTLPVCINFQRSSPAMWQGALKTYEDPETKYLFFPELSTAVSPEKVRTDLLKHKLGLQPNKHTEIWLAISKTLHQHYGNDPREIIKAADSDAGKLVKLLQKDLPERFPYLRGPKLSNYWPFILSEYTDVKFKNAHEISIIPDTHIIQCTIHLGMVPPNAKISQVEEVWRELLKDSGISPVMMHPVLWNWSRNKFQPTV